MQNRLVENRYRLSELIYDLGVFTSNELVEAFRKSQDGGIAIDGGQTIRDYLDELSAIGVLRYEYDLYTVVGHNSARS